MLPNGIAVQRELIDGVTVRETDRGIQVLLPPSRTLGFSPDPRGQLVRWLWCSAIAVIVIVAMIAASMAMGLPRYVIMADLVVLMGLLLFLQVGIPALVFDINDVIARRLPLRIELGGQKLTFGWRLWGPLREAAKVEVTNVTSLGVLSGGGTEMSAYGEPATLLAFEGEDDLHLLIHKYPQPWVEAVAALLIEEINARRDEGAPTVRVVKPGDPIA